jgi:hypothetical protein
MAQRSYATAFADDDDSISTGDAGTAEHDYVFEGYSVEFNDKIALLPIVREPH